MNVTATISCTSIIYVEVFFFKTEWTLHSSSDETNGFQSRIMKLAQKSKKLTQLEQQERSALLLGKYRNSIDCPDTRFSRYQQIHAIAGK